MRHHDEQLGGALRGLRVPEHGGDFFDTLENAMRESDRLAEEKQEHPVHTANKTRNGHRWGRVLIPTTVAALLMVALVTGPLRSILPDGLNDVFEPSIATAAEVQARAAEAVATAKAISGTLVITDARGGQAATTMQYRFVATAGGDVRLSGSNELDDGMQVIEERAYDAGAQTEMGYSIAPEGAGGTMAWKRTGLAPGLPDQAASDLLGSHFGDIVLALAQAQDPSVREATYEGRDAWVLSEDVEPNLLAEGAPDHVEVTVDRQTGFPVRVARTVNGSLVQETRLEKLRIDPDLPSDTFTLTIPEGAEYYESDAGFRAVPAAEAAMIVGYKPVLPGWLPDGFELAEVAVAEEAYPTGKEGGNPVSRGVVSALYRRGFQTLLVTTRLVGADPSVWTDPLSLGEGYIDRPLTADIDSGSFAGTAAELALDPRGIPHLWVRNDMLVLTVSGGLSGDDLLRVAGSMAE